MKVIIDIPDEDFEFNMNCCPDLTDLMVIYNAIRKGKSLPDNATNGDVIKALFSNDVKVITQYDDVFGERFIYLRVGTEKIDLKWDWWNAPYKSEIESQESENL